MVGIKGAGMAALAQILQNRGAIVCGSDTDEQFFTDALLQDHGIVVEQFDGEHITKGFDALVYSTGYAADHPEIRAARSMGIPMSSYPETVGELFNDAYGIAVCGSHGKTTITALAAWVFSELGLDPTALIGSAIQHIHTNVYIGSSSYWILEADEYQNKFEQYRPRVIIASSVEYDHPDYFKTEREYIDTFQMFFQTPSCELLVAGVDDPGIRLLIQHMRAPALVTYGFHESSDYRISAAEESNSGFSFEIVRKKLRLGTFHISLIGKHNISNASGVLALVHALELGSLEAAARAISSFPGTERRCELIGKKGKTLVIDDYAHHPTEISATLSGIRARYPGKKIWCCFGPHTFSRTAAFFEAFVHSFQNCDQVLVLDIYPSAREQKGSIHAKDLTDAIQHYSANALYTGSIEHTIAFLGDRIHDIDILITMGAGDVWKVGRGVVS